MPSPPLSASDGSLSSHYFSASVGSVASHDSMPDGLAQSHDLTLGGPPPSTSSRPTETPTDPAEILDLVFTRLGGAH